MPQTVNLPDGTKVNFPDGMSQDDIGNVLKDKFSPKGPGLIKSFEREATSGAGKAVQALATLGEYLGGGSIPRGPQPIESYGAAPKDYRGGVPKLDAPEISQARVDAYRNEEAKRFMDGLQANPLYRAGRYMKETGAQMPEPQTKLEKIAGGAGGLATVAIPGIGIPSMVAQGFGDQFQSTYDQAKAKGMSDSDALTLATQRAVMVGGTEGAAWALLPPFLKNQINKVTGKIGAGAVTQFAARRLAGAAETGLTGGAVRAAENVETGKPLTQDVGSAALGGALIGGAMSLIHPPDIRFKPPVERPAPKLLADKPVTPIHVGPEGEAMSRDTWENLSPKERREWQRNQEALSRQTDSGRQRAINTIDAALKKGDSPIGWDLKEQGATWYKEDGRWRTTKPSASFNVQQLDPNKPAHAEVIAKLERRLRSKTEQELAKLGAKSGLQQKIEDLTGISRPKSTVEKGGAELASREIWEKEWNKRFAVPLADYGPNGKFSMKQQDFLKTFPETLKNMSTDQVQGLYSTLTGGLEKPYYRMGFGFAAGSPRWRTVDVKPQGMFENEVMRLIKERLGITTPPEPQKQIGGKALPLLKEGEPNAPQERQKQVNVPPERPGDGGGGTPTETSPGSVVPPATEQQPQAPEVKPAAPPGLVPETGLTGETLRGTKLMNNAKAITKDFFASISDNLDHTKNVESIVSELASKGAGMSATESAYQYAAHLRDLTPEQALPKIKALYEAWKNGRAEIQRLGKEGKMNEAIALGAANQFPREAWQAATGTLSGEKGVPEGKGHGAALPIEVNQETGEISIKQKAAEAAKSVAEKTLDDELKRRRKLAEELVTQKFGNEYDYKDAFPEASTSRDALIKAAVDRLELGADEKEVQKVFEMLNKRVSDPDRARAAINRIPVDPAKVKASVKKQYNIEPTPSEKAAVAAKTTGEGAAEAEALKKQNYWRTAYHDYISQLKTWRDDFIRNQGRAPKASEIAKFQRENQSFQQVQKWKKEFGADTIDPGRWLAKQAGRPVLRPETSRSELNEGDRVMRRAPDGTIEEGIVMRRGATLEVHDRTGQHSFGHDLSKWEKDTRPIDPKTIENYPEAKFQEELKKRSGLKGERSTEELYNALDKTAPGIMRQAMDKINRLRQELAARGIHPDTEGHDEPERYQIDAIQESLARAAKYQHLVDRGWKRYEQSEADFWLQHAKDAMADRPRPEASFRAKAEDIAQNLERLRVTPPDPRNLNILGLGGAYKQLWNDAISAAQTAIRAGGSTLDGIRAAVGHISNKVGEAWNKLNLQKWLEDRIMRPESETPPPPKDFLKTFVNESVAPLLVKGQNSTQAAYHLIVDWFAPTTRAPRGDLDKLMTAKGWKDKFMLRASHAVMQARDYMGSLPRNQQIDFVDRVKRGIKQPTPELQQIADLLRKWDDRLYVLSEKYSPGLPYLSNHLRVLWKVIPGTRGMTAYQIEQIMSKRPWRGSRGFLLRHTLENMSEGIEQGGVPVTYNPVEMFLLHAQDVTKFVSANRAWETLKDSGRAVYVERGDNPPDDSWGRINDTIAKQYFTRKETTPEGEKRIIKPGDWFVDRNTARLINNYLSRDFIRENSFGRALMDLKNMSTAVELGVSPFHAAFVTNESIGSSVALAIRQGLRGEFGKAGENLWDAATAVPGLAESLYKSVSVKKGEITTGETPRGNVARLGRAVAEYARSPEEFKAANPKAYEKLQQLYPEFKKMINDLFAGGGIVNMHEDYKIRSAKGFEDAWHRNNYVKATAQAIPALNQYLLKPIFQDYIPQLKLGHFIKEYADALETRKADLDSGKITRPELARETWAFVDDRFGELNWDNLYWNRTFKSMNQLAFRSVTWKLGNIRGFGKAIRDTGSFVGDIARVRKPTLTQPMAWLFGMALVTTVQSTILSKIFTGKYPWELAEDGYDLIKNLTFPRVDATDPSQRVSTPTYWKDAVHFIHSPFDYARSSLTGEWGRMWDIWNNKDFYGTQVYNPDDPFWKRQEDKAIHLMPLPFSISSQLAAERSGSSATVSHLGQMGFTKAPYYMSHTPAELKASELMQAQLPQGARTHENALKSIRVHKAVQAIKRGDMTMEEAIDKGLIDERKIAQVQAMVDQSYLVTQIKRSSMTPEDAIKIWHVANRKEREDIREAVELKIMNSPSLEPDDRERLLNELEKNP